LSELLDLNPFEHTCILAQIVSIEKFTRLVLRTKDIDGEDTVVAWYTPNAGLDLDIKAIKSNYTVTILEARPHDLLDGSLGVRIEDPCIAKVYIEEHHGHACY
jgi:hypothetical protein